MTPNPNPGELWIDINEQLFGSRGVPDPEATPESVEDLVRPYADLVSRLGKPVGRRVALAEPSVILPRAASPLVESEADEEDEEDE